MWTSVFVYNLLMCAFFDLPAHMCILIRGAIVCGQCLGKGCFSPYNHEWCVPCSTLNSSLSLSHTHTKLQSLARATRAHVQACSDACLHERPSTLSSHCTHPSTSASMHARKSSFVLTHESVLSSRRYKYKNWRYGSAHADHTEDQVPESMSH